jgi:hypothetical protein
MRLSNAIRLGVVLAGGALLVHCGGFQQRLVPLAASPGLRTAPSQSVRSRDRDRQSWMVKGIGQRDLLYVSNANGTVSVYTYWQRRIVGVLTNFTQPQGECSDAAGDVYIADHQTSKVSEYAHGGKKPISVLDDSPDTPDACAVDHTTGNVAVANYPYGYYSNGDVAIFLHGKGSPILYKGAAYNDHFISVAYDDRGDLFAASIYGYLSFYSEFYYLPRHGTKLILMNLPPPQGSYGPYAQSVAWDGKYWVVANYNALYRYTINIKAQYISETALNNTGIEDEIALFRKSLKAQATQVVGGSSDSVNYWQYPAGGNPIGSITKDLDAPYGAAISLAPQ